MSKQLLFINCGSRPEAYQLLQEIPEAAEILITDIVPQGRGFCLLILAQKAALDLKHLFPDAFVFEEHVEQLVEVIATTRIGKLEKALLVIEFRRIANVMLFLGEFFKEQVQFTLLEFRFAPLSGHSGRIELSVEQLSPDLMALLEQDESLEWYFFSDPSTQLKRIFN